MRVAEIGELSLLERIRDRFRVRSRDVIAGIGDDAAVIAPLDQNLLLTTDMMVEGVHFDLRFTTPYQLGFKIVSVNVSDIYAMGGRPRFVLLDLGLDGETDDSFIDSFCAGMEEAMGMRQVTLPRSIRRSPGRWPSGSPERPATQMKPPSSASPTPRMKSHRPRAESSGIRYISVKRACAEAGGSSPR